MHDPIVQEPGPPARADLLHNPLPGESEESVARRFMPWAETLSIRAARSLADSADAVNDGYFGLAQAIQRWDPKRGVKLKTYAAPYVTGWVKKGVRDRGGLRRSRELVAGAYRQCAKNAEEPTRENLAKRLPDIAEHERMLKAVDSTVYVDELPTADRFAPLSTGDHADEVANSLDLLAAFGKVPANERAAIALRYFEGYSVVEIAGVQGCSQMEASRRIRRGMRRLRQQMGAPEAEPAARRGRRTA